MPLTYTVTWLQNGGMAYWLATTDKFESLPPSNYGAKVNANVNQ